MKWIGRLAIVLVFGAGILVGMSRRSENGMGLDDSSTENAPTIIGKSPSSATIRTAEYGPGDVPSSPYSPQVSSDTNPVVASGDVPTGPPPTYPPPVSSDTNPVAASGGPTTGPTPFYPPPIPSGTYPVPTTGGAQFGQSGAYPPPVSSGTYPVPTSGGAQIDPYGAYAPPIPSYPGTPSYGSPDVYSMPIGPSGAYPLPIPSSPYPVSPRHGALSHDHDHEHVDLHHDHLETDVQKATTPAAPPTPALALTIADAPISENGGATIGTVSRSGDTSSPMLVTLSSFDIGEATVPSSITIPAGRSSANFTITGVDDSVADGTRTVTILAAAAGIVGVSDTVDVLDDEVLRQFDFGTGTSPVRSGYTRVTGTTTYSRSRGYGWSGGTVLSVDRGSGSEMDRDLNYRAVGTFVVDVPIGTYDVTLTVGDKGRYRHDQQVFLERKPVDTISTRSGEVLMRTYQNVAVADGQLTLHLDGRGGVDPNMIINALQVAEVISPPALAVTITDTSISEHGGRTTGTVTRIGDTTGSLLVSLSSDDTGEATVASTVTIANGQSSANFTISAVDEDDIDGTQRVTIRASASGLIDGSNVLDVLDDEVAPVAHRFDFGTGSSPLESGYTRVTGTTTYSRSRGYGWSGGTVKAVDRRTGTELNRDLNYRDAGTFVVDVPVGTYQVELTVGDTGPFPHDLQVFLEGAPVDTISTGARQMLMRTYNVAITDGQLTLRLDGRGGVDPNMIINALEVTTTASTAALAVTFKDTSISENGGSTTGTVTRIGETSGSLLVSLSSNDSGEATVPSTVTLASGQSSANFTIHAVDEGDIDGTQTVTIRATASGLTDGCNRLDVLDDEVAPVAHRFDFGTGTSPVRSGYTRVAGTTTYSGSRGYGWSDGTVKSVDRRTGTELIRDLNYRDVATFVVDVPVGTYNVTLTVGDPGPFPHDLQVFLEEASVDTISTAARQTLTRTYNNVAVSDGQLTLRLDGRGGGDPNMVINALEVTEIASTKD